MHIIGGHLRQPFVTAPAGSNQIAGCLLAASLIRLPAVGYWQGSLGSSNGGIPSLGVRWKLWLSFDLSAIRPHDTPSAGPFLFAHSPALVHAGRSQWQLRMSVGIGQGRLLGMEERLTTPCFIELEQGRHDGVETLRLAGSEGLTTIGIWSEMRFRSHDVLLDGSMAAAAYRHSRVFAMLMTAAPTHRHYRRTA